MIDYVRVKVEGAGHLVVVFVVVVLVHLVVRGVDREGDVHVGVAREGVRVVEITRAVGK